jgi:hypothetical protein
MCPSCGKETTALIPIDPGLRLRLQSVPNRSTDLIPNETCTECHRDLVKASAKGAVLRAELIQKEQNRLALWQGRVALIKKAKDYLQHKDFSQAAVHLEKYIRVLEIVYEQKPGTLTPELFRNEARRGELTIIAAAYWDLLRIYDINAAFAERQMLAAKQLGRFARYTPVFANIIRRAEKQMKKARNPAAFKLFLKISDELRPRCFIATAAFEGPDDTVDSLCEFRDYVLLQHPAGRVLIEAYYRLSPPLANALDQAPVLKPAARAALRWAASGLNATFSLKHRGEL